MSNERNTPRRVGFTVLAAAAIVAGGVGIGVAATHNATHASSSSASASSGTSASSGMAGMRMSGAKRGPASFGMTHAYFRGKALNFTYTKGFWCDTSVKSAASTGCEAGANYTKTPAKDFDPLYITVPLGFTPKGSMDCPSGITCVDHPKTIDLTRLEPALQPIFGLPKAKLTAALKNYMTPGHQHFVTTANGGKAEWWDVKVIGVTSAKTYAAIDAHKSYAYVEKLEKQKKVVGPIDTNLFLYFAVK